MDEVNRERCDLCDVKFTSHEHSISHYEGKKHKKKTCDMYAYAHSMKSRNPRFQQNYCHYCKIQVSGPAPMKQHQESARHIKKLQESRSRKSSADSSATSSSPPESVYNEFNIKPDSTVDFDEFNQENYQNSYLHRGSLTFQTSPSNLPTGPLTLQSSPTGSHTGPLTLQSSPPVYTQDQLQPAELAAKFNDMQIEEIKNQLMEPCKKLIQEELEKLVPVLAEKLINMTMESLRRVGMQQEALKLQHSSGQESMVADTTTTTYGPFTTSASSVCNQLFPSGHYQMAPTPMNGHHQMAVTSMNGHHSFAGSAFHSRKVSPPPPPPPGFDNISRVDTTEMQNQF